MTSEDRQETADFSVVIPAAGSGSRIGGTRKQFRKLGRYNPLLHCVRAFAVHPRIADIIVVGPEKDLSEIEFFLSDIANYIRVVAGGSSRQESVFNGLSAEGLLDYVLIHDAVRPFVDDALLGRVMAATVEHGAAAPAIPVYDSVRRGDDDTFGRPIPREGLFRVQTPQGFHKEVIVSAHKKAREDGWEGTDDVSLVSRFGRPVYKVDGSGWNLKITAPDDWEMAEALWSYWEQR
ncbi:MAG: 2-C-methyl-D-erythritol 4-phosphate cytidylyltransferase [Rhodothermales bacterium]|nr:2-C-methyl-D-erythritol 4-phosphate cytidylyltransferase [Rhodothermales bacterium]